MLSPALLIRPRTDADLPGCVALMDATHHHDGYPRYRHDWNVFLASPSEASAWVAELDGEVVGHVAIHRSSDEPVFPLAQQATGRPPERLAVLARLMISPRARRRGLARGLIEVATAYAADHDLRLVLDVLQETPDAVELYERLGWRRLGELILPLDDWPDLQLWVYLSPEPA